MLTHALSGCVMSSHHELHVNIKIQKMKSKWALGNIIFTLGLNRKINTSMSRIVAMGDNVPYLLA